jgi:hypothetical protein
MTPREKRTSERHESVRPEAADAAASRTGPERPDPALEDLDPKGQGEIAPGDEDGLPDRTTKHRVPS